MSNCDRVRLVLQVVVLTVLTVLTVAGQDRPNFLGEWMRLEPSANPSPVLTIVQNGRTIRIEARSPGPSSGTYEVGTGGVRGLIPGEIPRVQWSWKDGTLVVTFEGGRMLPGAVRQEVWSLDLQGRLVVVITFRAPECARDHDPVRLREETLSGTRRDLHRTRYMPGQDRSQNFIDRLQSRVHEAASTDYDFAPARRS